MKLLESFMSYLFTVGAIGYLAMPSFLPSRPLKELAADMLETLTAIPTKEES